MMRENSPRRRKVCVRIVNFEFVLDKEDSFGYHIKCEKMS